MRITCIHTTQHAHTQTHTTYARTHTHTHTHPYTLIHTYCRGAGDADDGIGGAEDSQSEGERMRTNVYLPTELM